MDLEFLKRCHIFSIVLTIIVGVFFCIYLGWGWARDFVVISFLSQVNFFLLTQFLISFTKREAFWKKLIRFLVKFPLIYFIAYLYFTKISFKIIPFLLGFNMIFLVIMLRMVGRAIITNQRERNKIKSVK